MTVGRKRQLAVLLVLTLAAWPLLHRGLVGRYGLNPWRFFGWAMYCTPVPAPEVRAYVFSQDAGLRSDARGSTMEALEDLVEQFREQRSVWGELRTPEALGRALLAARADAAGVEIEVLHLRLDPRTARMVEVPRRYRYLRRPEERQPKR